MLGGLRAGEQVTLGPSNTTLGTLIAALDGSIVIISLPAIFRGIGLDPLAPANIGYLL